MNKQELIKQLAPFGQEHLVNFWDDLNETEKCHLQSEIQQTDFGELNKYFERVHSESDQNVKEIDELMNPVPDELKGSFFRSSPGELKEFELAGLKTIAHGQVAVLLLAGGQGTRLGVNYPKGMYSVGLKSGKTLYQLQAERLVRLKQLALKQFPQQNGADESKCLNVSSSIPWYIMTSEHTKESTQEFFKNNGYFGLDKENIVFFEQFMLPCLTNSGKIILDEKHKMSRAPDGNGGLYRALFKRKIIDDMLRRGIKYVHVYCVDNILVKMADPVFIGFCLKKNANCAAKVVRKTEPDEKVGVICKVGDRFQVVEYSEISEATRNLRDKNGDLVYNAGNICNHFLSTDFLSELCTKHESELKHHVAHKKIPYIDDKGQKVVPKDTNGIKLEKFVFDVFPFSTNFAIWEVPREEEFSPLKNSEEAKKETPTTCRNDLYAQHVRWLKAAGATFKSSKPDDQIECEISPLVSYNGEGLNELVSGKRLDESLSIEFDKFDAKVKFNGLELDEYVKQVNQA